MSTREDQTNELLAGMDEDQLENLRRVTQAQRVELLKAQGGGNLHKDVVEDIALRAAQAIAAGLPVQPYTREEASSVRTDAYTQQQLDQFRARKAAQAALEAEERAAQGIGPMKLRRLSEINVPPPTRWLAPGWVPRREITVLVGEEGIGKSLFWVYLAAHITTGMGSPALGLPERAPADVALILTEDSAAEVVARLEAAGADLTRIHLLCSADDGTGTPVFGDTTGGDMAALRMFLGQMEEPPALVVVDAWLDTVAGSLNVRDTQQARAALHPWKVLADQHDTAVMLVTHTNRLDTANTRDLMGGTAALRQKARMVLFAARAKHDYEDHTQHLWLGPDKANSTRLSNAVRFDVQIHQARPRTVDDPGTTARLGNPAETPVAVRALVEQWRNEQREAEKPPTRAVRAADAVREYMAERGITQAPTKELQAHLKELGYSRNASMAALNSLGSSRPSGQQGAWIFTLDTEEIQTSPQSPHIPGT